MRRFAEFREELEEKATEEEGSRAEQLEEENFIDPFDPPHKSGRVCGAVKGAKPESRGVFREAVTLARVLGKKSVKSSIFNLKIAQNSKEEVQKFPKEEKCIIDSE